MQERVRVGVVGTSWFAEALHLPSLASHPRAEIAAICGRNRGRAEEVAAKFHIARVVTDYRALIEQGELDAIVIITPDDLHYPMTMAALDAGLHVLCEKPLALTAADAEAMYRRAEAAGVKHMTDFTYRWMPYARHVRRLLDDGYIGRPFQCAFRYIFGSQLRNPRYAWRFDGRRANGILGDVGAHVFDLARWFVGDIAAVSGRLAAMAAQPGPDGQALDRPANDAAVVALQFVNGAQGVVQLSAVDHVGERGQEQDIALYGAGGTLEVSASHLGAEVRGVRREETRFSALPIPDDLWGAVDRSASFVEQLVQRHTTQPVGDRLFIDAILEDRPATPSFYDGWKAQQAIQAALEADRLGRWIELR